MSFSSAWLVRSATIALSFIQGLGRCFHTFSGGPDGSILGLGRLNPTCTLLLLIGMFCVCPLSFASSPFIMWKFLTLFKLSKKNLFVFYHFLQQNIAMCRILFKTSLLHLSSVKIGVDMVSSISNLAKKIIIIMSFCFFCFKWVKLMIRAIIIK